MQIQRFSLALLWMLLAGALAAKTAQLKNIRISDDSERTRVVVDIDSPATHSLFILNNPDRVVIDVPGARFALSDKIPAGVGAVENIRAANRENGMARLVLDMSYIASPKSFFLPPNDIDGNRLVIDLLDAYDSTKAFSSGSAEVVKRTPEFSSERDLIIAIDPGHGGKDPGGIGHSGLFEKHVVLKISRQLAKIIDAEPGMSSFLTRSDDRFLKLRERIRLARDAEADLFISIHADAFTDQRVRGSTVYVLSNKGATDEASALLAKRENATDLIGGADIADKDDLLASVLVDLSQNESLESSIEAGNLLVGELAKVGKVRKKRVQQAGFLVLKSPDIPSVLVETAFISNPEDERNLRSEKYQKQLSKAILNGVRSFFYDNPPLGTKIARLIQDRGVTHRYIIRSGDTLSQIAQRYNVTVPRILSANGLNSVSIQVGQVLKIPPLVGT
ncbi:MAG: N-acetylmuramoyl-L-alanine amidase [Pseudomonadota bacterium]|nr:N-acetylmuramoyl-L-alanine amidase [Pseudomonadota bacterium]